MSWYPLHRPPRSILSRSIFPSLFLVIALALTQVACSNGETQDGSQEGGDEATGEVASAEGASSEEEVDEEATEEEEEEKKKPPERTISINASQAFRGDLVVPVIAEGTIRARKSGDIVPEISGRIVRIPVEEGQWVRRGQLLVRLDDREYKVDLDEARSEYLEALSRLAVEQEALQEEGMNGDLAEALRALDELEKSGSITREEKLKRAVDLEVEAVREGAYRRELVEARTGLLAARAKEDRARLMLERTEIRAPFAGVITRLDLDPGENVSVGQPICMLVDNVDIEAEVGVLESDLGGIEVGRPALLTVPALGETFPVKVDVISPDVETDSRTCRVLLRLKNEDGRLRPGMFVRAAIAADIYPDRLLVPREAILTRDGRPLLFRVEEDRAKWVYVRLGLRNDSLVEIERVLQGGPLDEGTQVVVSDHLTLTHDAKIKVKKVVEASDAWTAYLEEE